MAFYSFLNNNPLNANATKINEIKNFVQDAEFDAGNPLVDYLYENREEEEAIDFVSDLKDLAVENDAVFTFEDSLNSTNSLNLNSVEELQLYLDNFNDSVASNISLINNSENTKTARFSFDLGLLCYLNVQVKQKLLPEFSIENVTSSISGNTVITDWKQNDDFDMTTNGNVVTVTFTGTLSLNCFFEGVGVFFSDYVTITVKLNKTTGALISGTLAGLD